MDPPERPSAVLSQCPACSAPLSLLSLARPGFAVRGKPVQRGEGSLDLRFDPFHPYPAPLRGRAMYRDVRVPRVQDAYERPSAALILGSTEGDLQGKDCSQQSFCIPTIPGGQMSEGTTPGREEVELRQEQQPRAMQEQLPRRKSKTVKSTNRNACRLFAV